jgi:predicted nucleic acid-binding protein
MAFLVDSNLFIDMIYDDPVWSGWSRDAVRVCASGGRLLINQIIYSELSANYSSVAELERVLSGLPLARENLPWEAGFMAGQAYAAYRKNEGRKSSPLADFYIGAHAATKGYRLITRDAARYKTYFPKVVLICPD